MSPQVEKEMRPPKIFLLIENPSKSNNLGPILRCGAAYSASFVFVGYEKCSVDGSHGANKHVKIVARPSFQKAVEYIRKDLGVKRIIGIIGDASFKDGNIDCERIVEADSDGNFVNVSSKIADTSSDCSSEYAASKPVHLRSFNQQDDVCFLIYKRACGIPCEQARLCDSFVHVSTGAPLIAADGSEQNIVSGLLDSQTALSLCLHHYSAAVGYRERDFVGQKFQVSQRKGRDEDEIARIREERRLKRLKKQKEEEEALASGEVANLFE